MKQGLQQTNVFIINNQLGETVPLTVGTTSTSVSFVNLSSLKNYDVMVTNAGTKTAYINFGLASAGAVTAQLPASGGATGTTGATPVLGGAIYTFQKNSDAQFADTCAAITRGSDTTTLYFTSVQGS